MLVIVRVRGTTGAHHGACIPHHAARITSPRRKAITRSRSSRAFACQHCDACITLHASEERSYQVDAAPLPALRTMTAPRAHFHRTSRCTWHAPRITHHTPLNWRRGRMGCWPPSAPRLTRHPPRIVHHAPHTAHHVFCCVVHASLRPPASRCTQHASRPIPPVARALPIKCLTRAALRARISHHAPRIPRHASHHSVLRRPCIHSTSGGLRLESSGEPEVIVGNAASRITVRSPRTVHHEARTSDSQV